MAAPCLQINTSFALVLLHHTVASLRFVFGRSLRSFVFVFEAAIFTAYVISKPIPLCVCAHLLNIHAVLWTRLLTVRSGMASCGSMQFFSNVQQLPGYQTVICMTLGARASNQVTTQCHGASFHIRRILELLFFFLELAPICCVTVETKLKFSILTAYK